MLRMVKGLPGVPQSRRAYAALPNSDKNHRFPAMILSSGVSRYSRSVNHREISHNTFSGAEPYATGPQRPDVGHAVAPLLMHALIHRSVDFASFFLRGLWIKDNTLWCMVRQSQRLARRAVRKSAIVRNSRW